MYNLPKQFPTTTHAPLSGSDERAVLTTTGPTIASRSSTSSAFPAPDRSTLKWSPGLTKVSLRAVNNRHADAYAPAPRPATAIFNADYDGALEALRSGGMAVAYCQPGKAHETLGKLHALTLLSAFPAPVEFIRAFLAKVAELQPHAMDQPDNFGRTALTAAVERNDTELIALLLEAGADPAALDGKQQSALQLAADKGHANALAAMHACAAKHALGASESQLIADSFKAGNTDTLRLLAGISPSYARGVMKHIVHALPEDLSNVDAEAKQSQRQKRENLEKFLPLLDNDHHYHLLLELLAHNGDAASLMLQAHAPGLTPDRLRAVRHAAAERGNAAVHEWAASKASDMPGSGAAVTALNAELLLALRAANGERAIGLIKCGADTEALLSACKETSLLALLAECHPDLLAQHMKKTGTSPTLDDLLHARSATGMSRMTACCDLQQLLPPDFPLASQSLAIKAAKLGCASLLPTLFRIDPTLKRPWAGMQDFPAAMGSMKTPLKTAIGRCDYDMVHLLLQLGTVPTKYDLAEAREYDEHIAATLDAAYLRIPEEERV